MKRVISISLGSSKRDHRVEASFLGQKFVIERLGTDGDFQRARELLAEMDGQVDAFGLGGIDLYVTIAGRRYHFRDARRLAAVVTKTPLVDGSGLKNTLERRVIQELAAGSPAMFAGRRTLLVSGADRWGMAEGFNEVGAKLTCGDLIFALGLPIPLTSLRQLKLVASIIGPVLVQLPFKLLYPTGKKQEMSDPKPGFAKYYLDHDIIAGDYLFIKQHLPAEIPGKIIITNTVTAADIVDLTARGAKTLVTTTPELDGRSFGTNVMEAVLVCLSAKDWRSLTPSDYNQLLDRLALKPRIVELN